MVNPVCNSCEQEMLVSKHPGKYCCDNSKCPEDGLTQSVNEAVQTPVCGKCGTRHAIDSVCVPDDLVTERHIIEDRKPEQAVKGKTGADTIKAREAVYGPFAVHAKAEQEMKRAMTSQQGWELLDDVQKSAAEMIVHKLARILNGSANYDDNWHDISGYATLAEQAILKGKGEA
jgi:hypothetical protein